MPGRKIVRREHLRLLLKRWASGARHYDIATSMGLTPHQVTYRLKLAKEQLPDEWLAAHKERGKNGGVTFLREERKKVDDYLSDYQKPNWKAF